MFKRLSIEHKIRLGVFSAFVLLSGFILFYATNVEKPLGEGYKSVEDYGGEFKLMSHEGEVELRDFRDKVVVAYFGFLNCTEACPQAMAIAKAAVRKLTDEEKQKLQILFISVDPERDTPENLQAFSSNFVNTLAITGTREQIDNVTQKYGVFYELIDLEGSALDYTVDHSSRFYMINKAGVLETTMSHSTTPTELAAMIRKMQLDNPQEHTK